MAPGSVGRILKRLLGVRGHRLRHRFATNVHERTGNLLALQQLLGHSSPNTTAIYAQVSDATLLDVVSVA